MSKLESMTPFYTNQGGQEAMIGEEGTNIPLTIDGSRLGSASANVTIKGPALYARRSASPYKAIPFMNSSAITSPTNTTNATVDVVDADAVKFKVGDACAYYTISSGAYYTTETRTISAIGAAGSGTGGAGYTKITFTGVWTTPPAGSSACLLMVSDGAEQSANVLVVMEDVTFDGSTDFASHGFVQGVFLKAKVNNTTYFDQTKHHDLRLIDMQ